MSERRNTAVALRKLPLELFTDILLLSLSKYSWLADIALLASVSRFWKQAVKGSPRFFAYLDQSYSATTRAAFLRRSRSAPLDVEFFWRSSAESSLPAFLTSIAAHSNHIRSLDLEPWAPTEAGLQLFQTPLPMLEELTFTILPHHCQPYPTLPLPRMPALRRLSLEGVSLTPGLTWGPRVR